MKNDDTSIWTQRVREYRNREGISQEELAKRLGISRNYVSMIEGGQAPSDQLVRHFNLLETSPIPSLPKNESAALKAHEAAPDYGLVKKILVIAEQGTPEQIELVNSFLDSVCKQLGISRDKSDGDPQSTP